MSPRIAAAAALAILLHAAAVTLTAIPGHLSIDEATYHLMARSLSQGSLTVANGYETLPSPELELATSRTRFIQVSGDRLVGKYPVLFPALAAPLYGRLGYAGLILLNALAYGAAVLLTFLIARRVGIPPPAATAGCALFVLGTFSWEYAQAAWPHAAALAAALGATLLGLDAARAADGEGGAPRGYALALGAGLTLGAAAGMRLDAVLILPALGLILLAARPWPGLLASLGAGCLPGFALLAATNLIRFDTLNPFSYGEGRAHTLDTALRFLPAAALGLAVLGLRIAWDRPRFREIAQQRWRLWLKIGGLAALAALLIPSIREAAFSLVSGGIAVLVDMRAVPQKAGSELARGPTGELLFIGGIKKALLQSCPWAVAVILPLWRAARGDASARRLLPLALPLGVVWAAYSVGGWHGGLCLNMRYLLPSLPFAAILAAESAAWLWAGAPSAWRRAAGILLAAGAAAPALAFLQLDRDGPGAAALVQTAPLFIAGAATLAALALTRRPSSGRIQGALLALLALGAGWASATALAYDAPLARAWRARDVRGSERILPHVEGEGALIFASPYGVRFGLYGVDGLAVADPTRDRFASFRALVDRWHALGQPVYAWLPDSGWAWLNGSPHFAGLGSQALTDHGGFELRRIIPILPPSPAPEPNRPLP